MSTKEATPEVEESTPKEGAKRGVSILDLFLRIAAAAGTLGGAIAMGTTNQALLLSTQLLQFRAEYDDLPTFKFFVVANSIACGYLVLSLPVSIFHIFKSATRKSRMVLLVLDMVMLALVTAGASAATGFVYLAYKGDAAANWPAICQLFNSFCARASGSLIGSFGAMIAIMLLIITTTLAISRP